ncbi:MAG: COQ9 family protein [Rickettsiales bacterium]|nr:COQ9 family protein [Rickettsiales bacterium]
MRDIQRTILEAALPLIPFEGWSMSTLEKAASEAKLSPLDAQRAFPEGITQALQIFSADADEKMLQTLESDYSMDTMKIRERISTAVMVRLKQNLAHREAVRRGLAYFALPWNMPAGTQSLYKTVDAMWKAAGDTSTDFNFYTKRATLAKVYMTTLSVWLNDDSDELADTQAFLARRIEDVMQIEKLKANCRKAVENSPLSTLFKAS